MRSLLALVLVACPALGLGAQRETVAAGSDSGRARVAGTVYDSLAGAPLPGALVQFVAVRDSTGRRRAAATTDSAGRFVITGLAPGDYAAGFFHPTLDSLGLESAPRPVRVTAGMVRLDLATPSAATLGGAICPADASGDSIGVILGRVRATATAAALANASVSATWTSWSSLTGEQGTWRPREQRAAAETTSDGWYALCGLPADVPLLVQASLGADSSGVVRTTLPGGGLRHLPWLVGRAAGAPLRLTGRVRDATGRPVLQAQAMIWGAGAERATDASGMFTLDSLAGGTQTLEVRAIGFVPVTRVLHLSDAQSGEITVTLAERVTTLPAMTVRAREGTSLGLRSFYDRMRDAEKGINRGYFITPEELERRRPPLITNMFDGLPGVVVERNPFNHLASIVRGPLREGLGGTPAAPPKRCLMNVFLDGVQIVGGLGAGEQSVTQDSAEALMQRVDANVIPSEVAAIEVYPHPVNAPPRYQSLNGKCGVILIWTR